MNAPWPIRWGGPPLPNAIPACCRNLKPSKKLASQIGAADARMQGRQYEGLRQAVSLVDSMLGDETNVKELPQTAAPLLGEREEATPLGSESFEPLLSM
jgi:hypothetical protein